MRKLCKEQISQPNVSGDLSGGELFGTGSGGLPGRETFEAVAVNGDGMCYGLGIDLQSRKSKVRDGVADEVVVY